MACIVQKACLHAIFSLCGSRLYERLVHPDDDDNDADDGDDDDDNDDDDNDDDDDDDDDDNARHAATCD